MAVYGLRIKHQTTGAVILEYTDRITRTIGSFNTGTSNGSFSVSVSGTAWFALMSPGQYGGDLSPPNISISGNTITWTFVQSAVASRIAVDVIYGVY